MWSVSVTYTNLWNIFVYVMNTNLWNMFVYIMNTNLWNVLSCCSFNQCYQFIILEYSSLVFQSSILIHSSIHSFILIHPSFNPFINPFSFIHPSHVIFRVLLNGFYCHSWGNLFLYNCHPRKQKSFSSNFFLPLFLESRVLTEYS